MPTRIEIRRGVLSPLACVLLGACSLYTFERDWSVSVSTDQYTTPATQEAAFAEKWSHLRPDLRECVAANDPERLGDVDKGKGYRIDGWFLDHKHTDAVIDCMRLKGYSISGPAM